MSQLTSALEQSKQSNADLKEKVEECLRKIRDSKEDQANIEEQLRMELVSKVRGGRERGRRGELEKEKRILACEAGRCVTVDSQSRLEKEREGSRGMEGRREREEGGKEKDLQL